MERKRLRFHEGEDPVFLEECAKSHAMLRLKGVGMNCGVEYTSFPRFVGLPSYTRYEHSLDCARIALHFGGTSVQVLSCLFHDIATPCFSHVIDFLEGDYSKQEATERGTLRRVRGKSVSEVLSRYGISPYDVADYHRFPLCDNDAPRLSCDRLEYSLSNMVNFGFVSLEKAQQFYDDLIFDMAEGGTKEIVFRSFQLAREFGFAALRNSEVYICPEDRGSMEVLAELLAYAIEKGIITKNDLFQTEKPLIKKLLADKEMKERWEAFTSLREVVYDEEGGKAVLAKLRYIDPYVKGQGRLSELCPGFKRALEEFKKADFSVRFRLSSEKENED